ncbi:hypothetical protein CVT26_016161 [Gymnopilus dilepis]|uniref:Ornithine cyclodeaminase n=1 Tax=Gymnopilus dilepis TaxID=231916 RepID=A0A409XZ51_9AGAR|nr:hypothetical protein CVT26_016161 [Gymnopilus dilepis]
MSLLVLSATDVDAIASTLSPEELQLLMAKVFLRVSNPSGKAPISVPPRIVFPTANHTALFMPARIGPPSLSSDDISSPQGTVHQESAHPTVGSTAVKVVCVPKRADSSGLPATTLVLDEASGGVRAVVNARKLTALRNAAGSLLSTSLVGPPSPSTIVAFGAGQQIEAHLDLHIRHFPSINHCSIANRTLNARARSLQDKLSSKFAEVKFDLLSSDPSQQGQDRTPDTIEKAIKLADIIICATSSTAPLFPSAWVKAGTHVILIGSYTPTMREVDTALVLRALPEELSGQESPRSPGCPVLLVDSREACLHEGGELIDAQVPSEQMTELGELIPQDKDGILDIQSYERLLSSSRMSSDAKDDFVGPITMFKSVGIGLQDVAIASAIVDKALSFGETIGTHIVDYDKCW